MSFKATERHFEVDRLCDPIVVDMNYLDPSVCLEALRARNESSIIYLGGDSRYHILALKSKRLDATLMDSLRPRDFLADENSKKQFMTGIVGLLPYRNPNSETSNYDSKIYAVEASLVWDVEKRSLKLCYVRDLARNDWLSVVETLEVFKTYHRGSGEVASPIRDDGFHFEDTKDAQTYKNHVQDSIDDIVDGRFYQINLLRFFNLGLHKTLDKLFRHFKYHSGPHGVWLQGQNWALTSLSPERFVRIWFDQDWIIETLPIKGTIKRESSELKDEKAKVELNSSMKDRAELNMIIDLMRNDLHRICYPGTVKVLSEGDLETFRFLHHRIARIRGKLIRTLDFKSIWQALLPSGSITGAPKREVCKAIAEREERERGYFMGNVFCWDPSNGYLDSSVLIRTAYAEKTDGHGWNISYAAGSGIVKNSEPELEYREIDVKTAVLSQELFEENR